MPKKRSLHRAKRIAPEKAALLQLQDAVRRTRQPLSTISRLRTSQPVNAFPSVVSWIRSNATLRNIFHPEYPREAKDLKQTSPLAPASPAREFRWAAAYLHAHCDRIGQFLSSSHSFDCAYLSNDWSSCENILAEVRNRLGYSLWLIKRQIALLQVASGLEAQKRFVDEVRNTTAPGSIPAYVAHYVSIRNEPTVTAPRFQTLFETHLGNLRLPDDQASYIRHHIYPRLLIGDEVIADILRHEAAGAVVDYYEAVVTLAAMAASSADPELTTTLAKTSELLFQGTNDPRLAGILAALGSDVLATPTNCVLIKAIDDLCMGDFANAFTAAWGLLADEPANPDALITAAMASAFSQKQPPEDKCLVRRFVGRSARLLRRDDGWREEASELVKLGLSFFPEPWADALLALVNTELSAVPEGDPSLYSQLASVMGPIRNPYRLLTLPNGQVRHNHARVMATCDAGASVRSFVSLLAGIDVAGDLSTAVDKNAYALLNAIRDYAAGDYDSVVAHVEALDGPAGYFRRYGERLACAALLRSNRLRDAAIRLTDAYMSDPNSYESLPIADTVEALTHASRSELAAELSVPIVYDLSRRFSGMGDDSACVFRFLDVLEAHHVTRPSELRSIRGKFQEKKLVYFLRFVCVEAIMDRSGLFRSSRALLDERLKICRLLIDIDEAEIDAYQTEVKTLLRRLMLQKRMQQLEQSKIYVDTDSIKRTVSDDLGESFSRYMALRREKLDFQSSEEVESALRKASVGDADDLTRLTLPKNEVSELFTSLVVRLRDEYTLSPEHGLEKYLSVRIRHGTLSAQLRRPIDAAKLITAREVGSAEYKANAYWPPRVWADDRVRSLIAERLGVFSREFDALVDEILGWIKTSREGGTGMFDFTINAPLIRVWSECIVEDTTFEDFVDRVLDNFGTALDRHLAVVRERISGEAKTRASDLLDNLIMDVEELGLDADVRELTNAVRSAKTDLQVTFDRVGAWFRRGSASAKEPFSIEDAIEISAEAVRTVAPAFSVEVRSESGPIVLVRGTLLPIVVDIFFIIFDNVVRHAGFVAPLVARVSLEKGEEALKIRVENELGKPGDSGAQERVERIRRDMHDGQHSSSVSREGGTGLHKLGKLLTHDLGIEPNLEFGFMEGTFFVEFLTPVRWSEEYYEDTTC